jgi:hypothetical protein
MQRNKNSAMASLRGKYNRRVVKYSNVVTLLLEETFFEKIGKGKKERRKQQWQGKKESHFLAN